MYCIFTRPEAPHLRQTIKVPELEWVQKWVFGCKSGSTPTFHPTLNPFWDFCENPLFTQFRGGRNCFLKRALKQSRPSIKQPLFAIHQVFGTVKNVVFGSPDASEEVNSDPLLGIPIAWPIFRNTGLGSSCGPCYQ